MSEATSHIIVAHDDQRIIYTNGLWNECAVGAESSSRCTRDASATATFNFKGIMIVVAGRLSESRTYGSLHYVLDGKDDSYFSLSKSNTSFNELYSSPYLPYGDHTLTVRLAANDSTLFVEGMNITTPTGIAAEPHGVVENRQNHIPEIVGGTIGGAVGLMLVLVAVFFYQRRKIRLAATYSMGPMQASLPMSKEAFTSRTYSNYGLSFTPSPPQSTDSLTTLPPKTPRQPRKNNMVSITAHDAV